MPPFEIHVLAPSSTNSLPSRRAWHVIAATSEPAAGSDNANAAIASPRATRGRYRNRQCAAAEPLHCKGEVGETVPPGQRFAQHGDRTGIEIVERAAVLFAY